MHALSVVNKAFYLYDKGGFNPPFVFELHPFEKRQISNINNLLTWPRNI